MKTLEELKEEQEEIDKDFNNGEYTGDRYSELTNKIAEQVEKLMGNK